jgi:hypothetical protein
MRRCPPALNPPHRGHEAGRQGARAALLFPSTASGVPILLWAESREAAIRIKVPDGRPCG